MIANLMAAFSHKDFLILAGLFCTVVFLIFPIKKFKVEYVYRIIAACCLWWILLVFIYPPHGFNFEIYQYNASLTLNGQQSFDRNVEGNHDLQDYKHPVYMDYTGSQHLLYVTLKFISSRNPDSKLYGFGFQLWSILNITGIFLLIFYLQNTGVEEVSSNVVWPIICISFSPVLCLYNLIGNWEDKLFFLLLPLLILFLIEKKQTRLTSFLVGFLAAYNGITFYFLPLYIIYVFRENKHQIRQHLAFILAGLVISLIPYFPESLQGWINRFQRIDTEKPFWFSIYSLLPEGLYSSLLNRYLILFISLAGIILFLYKKINLVDGMLISQIILIILSPFNTIDRVLPLIFLTHIFLPDNNKYHWIGLNFILFIYLLFDNGYITPVVNFENTLLFYIPVIYSFCLYLLYKRKKYPGMIYAFK